MAEKRYFISHAGADKPVAIALKTELKDDAWVDLHEIEVGQILIEEISSGIEAASDFVLLWSSSSASSEWVKFELHMAFIRYLEDKAIALRVITLDETPLPLYLRPFLQNRGAASVAEMASSLRSSLERSTVHRLFFNRNEEINALEECLYSPDRVAAWVVGMGGSGKRSVAREAARRFTVGSGGHIELSIDQGIAEPELDLLISAALGVPPASSETDIATLQRRIGEHVTRYVETGGVWIFGNAEVWLDDDGTFGRLATLVMSALLRAKGSADRLAVFTSRRAPTLSEQWARVTDIVRLPGLDPKFAVPMLRSRGAKGTDDQLLMIASELAGHPLAIEIAAPQSPLNAQQLAQHRLRVATDLIPEGRIDSVTWRLLELLAVVDGPMSVRSLADELGIDSELMGRAIAEAVEYSLVEYGEVEHLQLHPLVRDYYLRSFRKQPDSIEVTSSLATRSSERLKLLPPESPEFVLSLVASFKLLAMAGRFDEARALRSGMFGTLFAVASEFFHEKQYEKCVIYIDECLTGNLEIDRDPLAIKAKALAHLGQIDAARAIGDELVEAFSDSPRVLRDRGRVEYIARNWGDAVGYYERALAQRRRPNPNVLTDIAQAEFRRGRLDAAGAAAKSAIDLGGDTPYTLTLYAQVLEGQGRLADAEKVVDRAVQREPRNAAYRHRLGRIAQLRGDRRKAQEQYEMSVELDAHQTESWFSLASLALEVGDRDRAETYLQSVQAQPGLSQPVLLNLQARIALMDGKPELARTLAEKALVERRDAQNIVLAIRTTIQCGEVGVMAHDDARAAVRRLAKELESQGKLAEVLDQARMYPKYF